LRRHPVAESPSRLRPVMMASTVRFIQILHRPARTPSLSRSGPDPLPLFRGSGDAAGMRMRGVKSERKASFVTGGIRHGGV
jgi:hypothetical protein